MTKLQSECLAEIWRHAVTLEAVSDKVVRREKLLRIRELVSKIQSIDAHPSALGYEQATTRSTEDDRPALETPTHADLGMLKALTQRHLAFDEVLPRAEEDE